jgi:hypothetical protein
LGWRIVRCNIHWDLEKWSGNNIPCIPRIAQSDRKLAVKQNTRCLVGDDENSPAPLWRFVAVGKIVSVSHGAISQCRAGSMKQGGYI